MINIFGGLPVGGTKWKKMSKKKKKGCRKAGGATAHFFLKARSRCNRLYRDIAQLGTRQHGAQAPYDTTKRGHDTADPWVRACSSSLARPS